MVGCVGVVIILFSGLLAAWIMFDPLDIMNDIWVEYTNTMGIEFPFKSVVDLAIKFFPLFLLIMAFVTAYLYLQRRRRQNENQ